MENIYNTPSEIMHGNLDAAVNKTKIPFFKLVILGIMAGAFIAFGGSSSNVAVHVISNPGLAKFVAGAIFPVGLMLIVFIGGELFTGDCMMINGVIAKRFSVLQLVRVLCTVWLTNLIGALIVIGLIYACGQYDMSAGGLGAYTIKVAYGKLNLSFGKCLSSGILCNILICLAVLMAGSAKDIVGKIWAIFFPIMAFVLGGYEHCVANMYYIPAGIMCAGNEVYAAKAMEMYGFTASQLEEMTISNMLVHNLLPVTIGNMLGGMVFVGLPLYFIHLRKTK